jgi:hypothetical protein
MGNHVGRYVLSLPMPELGFERTRGLGFEFLVCFLVSIPVWFLWLDYGGYCINLQVGLTELLNSVEES